MRQLIFNSAIQTVGRVLLLRDLLFGWARWNWHIDKRETGVSRHWLPCGRYKLDAVFVRPELQPRAALLICHGIGETVQRWHAVQRLLAENGVASVVFDYSGYGSSTGFFDAKRAEDNAIAAFHFLRNEVAPLPVSLMGFSLGSGVAAAILPHVPAHTLLLCAAFTSIREAAHSVGFPGWLDFGIPPIWRAEENLRKCTVPVLVMHGERDRLFPTSMATAIEASCASSCDIVLIPGLTHNEPFHRPTINYWGHVIRHVARSAEAR